jgi:hypothetical protein
MNLKFAPEKDEEAPPVFKTWNRFYMAVFANLVLLIILFYTFTKLFE